MYEYPDPLELTDEQQKEWLKNPFSFMLMELYNAINHDIVLSRCYEYYKVIYKKDLPFEHNAFFIYLSYVALSMNQKHLKMVMTTAEHSVNPSIVLQLGDDVYNKEYIDKLIRRYNKTYWQKLWDAIKGR